MDITIHPGKLNGIIRAIASKSQAHRLLICAAFSGSVTELICENTNDDIEATASCLRALGAAIQRTRMGYVVSPIVEIPEHAQIDCSESGSTLRFLLPVVCALGIRTTIHMHGRLPYRPLSPLWEELERMGCRLSRPPETAIQPSGKLRPGDYTNAGNVSSQFISGLLFALPLIDGESRIHITGNLESKPYVDMTQQALRKFGVETDRFVLKKSYPFSSPGRLSVEGDWSNAAFFLVANALGSDIRMDNLNFNSPQGDRAIAEILSTDTPMPVIDASNIPDLVPILAVYYAATCGAVFKNIARLRIKESDRVQSVLDLLHTFGIHAFADDNTLTVNGGRLSGGVVNSCNDHRIAMASAIAATVADGPVTILGAECVAKSYPVFWQDFRMLGGCYEQYIR